MVTLAKIAEESGFSVPVVSRALSPKQHKDTRMAASTREHIREVAERLGYRPNRVAEFMKRGQSPVIGCFLPARSDSLRARLVKGISEAAANLHFPLTFYFDSSEGSYRDFLNASKTSKNCGIITYPYFKSDPESERLLRDYRDGDGKIVLLEGGTRNWRWGDVISVSADDYLGGKMAAEHLLSKGVERFLSIAYTHIPERLEGFVDAVEATGGQVEVLPEDDDLKVVHRITALLEISLNKPVGVFAPQDPLGIAILCDLLAGGFKVGDNVQLISFDGLYSSGLTRPGLTTMSQPFEEIGAKAVEKLVELIYDQETTSETVAPKLIVRETA